MKNPIIYIWTWGWGPSNWRWWMALILRRTFTAMNDPIFASILNYTAAAAISPHLLRALPLPTYLSLSSHPFISLQTYRLLNMKRKQSHDTGAQTQNESMKAVSAVRSASLTLHTSFFMVQFAFASLYCRSATTHDYAWSYRATESAIMMNRESSRCESYSDVCV